MERIKELFFVMFLSLLFSSKLFAGECSDGFGGFIPSFTCNADIDCNQFGSGYTCDLGKGTSMPVNNEPTVNDITFTLSSHSEQHTFTLSELNYQDLNGDTISSIIIQQSATHGKFYIDANNNNQYDEGEVAPLLGQSGSNIKTDFEAGKLKYVPNDNLTNTSTIQDSTGIIVYNSAFEQAISIVTINLPIAPTYAPILNCANQTAGVCNECNTGYNLINNTCIKNTPPKLSITSGLTSNSNGGYIISVDEGMDYFFDFNAIDSDGDTITYGLISSNQSSHEDDYSKVTINSSTGILGLLGSVADYETKSSYSFNLTLSDDEDTTIIPITVNIKDINEAPTILTEGLNESNSVYTFNVDENTTFVYDFNASDPEGDKLKYSISGNDVSSFDIDATSGLLKLSGLFDYETMGNDKTFDVNVTVLDIADLKHTIQVRVNIQDVNDLGFNSLDDITVNDGTTNTIKIDLPKLDTDGDSLSFSNITIEKGLLATVSLKNDAVTTTKWQQIGQDIDGEAKYDHSGWSVALSSDGSIVAISARHNSQDLQEGIGHVRVYENINGTWTQIGQDIDGEAIEDLSGESISLSADGSIVAIGATHNDGNGKNSGHVRVYKNINGTWTQIGNDIDGESSGDESGTSVSLSDDGSIVAIGSRLNNGNHSYSGHVRIYKNINGIWTQIGQDIDGEASYDFSGRSVALSNDGSIVAIGAIGNNSSRGHVRIYKNINETWTQIGEDIDGEAANDYSGRSVSLNDDGSIVAIGAIVNDGNGSSSGHVRVYKNINGTWTQIGNDIDGEAANNKSGWSVSLNNDGSIVAIGAKNNNGNGKKSGHVRVYKNINGTWTQIGQDIDGEKAKDYSGFSVSLNSNGSIIANGAPFNDGNGSGSGHVRIYEKSNEVVSIENYWIELTPNSGVNDKTKISFTVSDTNGNSRREHFYLTVNDSTEILSKKDTNKIVSNITETTISTGKQLKVNVIDKDNNTNSDKIINVNINNAETNNFLDSLLVSSDTKNTENNTITKTIEVNKNGIQELSVRNIDAESSFVQINSGVNTSVTLDANSLTSTISVSNSPTTVLTINNNGHQIISHNNEETNITTTVPSISTIINDNGSITSTILDNSTQSVDTILNVNGQTSLSFSNGSYKPKTINFPSGNSTKIYQSTGGLFIETTTTISSKIEIK